MGRSTTPTYRVEFYGVVAAGRRVRHTPGAWNVRSRGCVLGNGIPTDERLAAYIEEIEQSTLPGEVNEHLGVTRIARAAIIHQRSGETVASYEAPLFRAMDLIPVQPGSEMLASRALVEALR